MRVGIQISIFQIKGYTNIDIEKIVCYAFNAKKRAAKRQPRIINKNILNVVVMQYLFFQSKYLQCVTSLEFLSSLGLK